MTISEQGLNLIKRFEGFRASAYLDSKGILTIGYGQTHSVKAGQTVTVSEADGMLRNFVHGIVEPAINVGVHVALTQDQFDALCSFIYNVGAGAFLSSTLLRDINDGSSLSVISAQFLIWDHAGSFELTGLESRRKAEAELYGGVA